ncbi:hypothetical protein [Flavobacterium sp. H122]|uniref:hypothetical protein n=1 Tax=Flavobacterium sp. H122 TaxID=2529860 RepID=UPI0010AAD7D9|nr:hypothetical protein [Flavobacterium sp. H122]
MKRFLKYIFFLFAFLLIGNALFAYSIREVSSLQKAEGGQARSLQINSFEGDLKTHYKHYLSVLEINKDVIEISEDENDTEDYHVSSKPFHSPTHYLDFFSGFLSGNFDIVEKSELTSYKFLSYLSTIDSLHIIFCVYRI